MEAAGLLKAGQESDGGRRGDNPSSECESRNAAQFVSEKK